MKCFLLFSCLELLACLMGYIGRSGKKINWMSREYTTALKGTSMLVILWSHVGITYGVKHIQFIGTVGVSLFIILSGFGIQLSTEARGMKDYWRKRILNVALPYWIAEAVGLIVTEQFTIERFALDFFFIKPAMGPGWFMQYIMICYLIFYFVNLIFRNKSRGLIENKEEIILYTGFLTWLVIDSLFLANPAMPFLRARQMLCFPFGITIAKHKEKIATILDRWLLILGGGIIGLIFMAVTQLRVIKGSPFLIQNLLSLPTVFPLAVLVLGLTKRWEQLLDNQTLRVVGLVSFEIYLVHAFTLGVLDFSIGSLIAFLCLTTAGVCFLYLIRKGIAKWLI